jgi:4-aminobutyrate aminotransferase-like enzyme
MIPAIVKQVSRVRRVNGIGAVRALGSSAPQPQVSVNTQKLIDVEMAKSAHNYHPVPVVLAKGSGVNVWDVDGKVCV